TLARIVADPAPPLRSLRPELSPALEQAVMRGLERDRGKRWPDLESFRQALLALIPSPLALHDVGVRVAAFALDCLVLWLVSLALHAVWSRLATGAWSAPAEAQALLLARAASFALLLVYFMVSEHVWGCTLGKG